MFINFPQALTCGLEPNSVRTYTMILWHSEEAETQRRGDDLPKITWLVRGWPEAWSRPPEFSKVSPELAVSILASFPTFLNLLLQMCALPAFWQGEGISNTPVPEQAGDGTQLPSSWGKSGCPTLPEGRVLKSMLKVDGVGAGEKHKFFIPSQQIVSPTGKRVLNTKSLFPHLRETEKRTHIWYLNQRASGMVGGGELGFPLWWFSLN